MTVTGKSFVLGALCALLCTAAQAYEPRLNAGGSTFVYPMMSKWSNVYDTQKQVQVNYQSVGSGAGIRQMSARTFDFGCSDGPMNEEQLSEAREVGGEVLHIPLVMGAVVPAYNLPGLTAPLHFSGPVLAGIFLGTITKWNDAAIAALNPGVALPAEDIAVVHRSDGSGTSYIWTDYLAKVSPEWKSKVGTGTSVNWPAGEGQKGNEGVAGQVHRLPGAIGYVELTYVMQNHIQFGDVQNRDGAFVTASLDSVTAAAAASMANVPDDLRYSITDAPGKGSYPISGTSWAIFYVNQPAEKAEVLTGFIRWITHEGQQFTTTMHYASLPPELVARIDRKLALIKAVK